MNFFKKIFTKKEKDCCSIRIEEVKENTNESNSQEKKTDCCK